MISRLLVSFILATTLFLTGCGEKTPVFEASPNYVLPEIMLKTPATGPDGYNWNISDQGKLLLEKEGESVTLEQGQTFYAEGIEWEINGFEENFVILTPVNPVKSIKPVKPALEKDPMYEKRRQLD